MTTPPTDQEPLPGARLAEELRLLLDALAERAQPMLNRLARADSATDPDAEHVPATCGWCPVCAGVALLRGERPELAVRAAEHAAGLLAVLRSALAERTPAPAAEPAMQHEPEHEPPSPAERVQHITVRRPGEDG